MFQLHVVQAAFGDCLLLEYGSNSPRFILIDGGPPDTYPSHLKPSLQQILQAAPLDLVVLSHVDNDHVTGLLDYFAELRAAPAGLPMPQGLWHNSFAATVDPHGVIAPRLAELITPERATVMSDSGMALDGVAEGADLRVQALALNIPINGGFPNGLITVDSAPGVKQFDDLNLTIVGPTQANLNALEQSWKTWLDKEENHIQSDDVTVMSNSDSSVPNLSSIMFLVKVGDRTMLLTGDGRSDHVQNGLKQAGLLDAAGKIHVNVLKLPHHGSSRNMSQSFFKNITADTYVVSANGKYGNPDLATLIWLVEAAKAQARQVEIVVTNQTPSVDKLLEEYPMAQYGYSLRTLAQNEHSILV